MEFRRQTGERTRKRKRAAARQHRQQREQRPVIACPAWRNAICLADGAAQLDDVRADMQHLALICASDATRSASKAFRRSDADEWNSAGMAEFASCLEHRMWHSCELPEGRQPLPSHFVYAQKWDGRYNARLVAGGRPLCRGDVAPLTNNLSLSAPLCGLLWVVRRAAKLRLSRVHAVVEL
jgi:hypothetical protein